MRYARLLHDFQWMPYKSRTITPGWTGLRSTPETVPLFRGPSYSGKDDIKLSKDWLGYLRAINTPRGYKFIMWPPAGWFNKNKAADTLGFGGNVVEVHDTINGFAQVKVFSATTKPPSPTEFNFTLHPELVHKFTVISRKGGVANPANGIDVYTFLIGRGGPLYVPLDRMELFPDLPVEVTVNRSLSRLDVMEKPREKSKVVEKLNPAKSIVIEEYAPRGVDVWGRCDKGWVQLSVYPKARQLKFFTSWRMKTLPALPPKTKNKKLLEASEIDDRIFAVEETW